jgi:ABC-type transport system substrate-binding protein/class 3 adenylate cyclase
VSATDAAERRVVSVLVADVAGSTTIAEQLGPERSKFLFDEVVRLMREEVERLGGTVAQLTGDGVLALFGAPVAHEDDSERAVRAALALHEALARYAAEVGPAYGIELAARVAVNTGPVVVPAGDAPPDVLYNALGDTVNVASRLQALGDVVVGPEAARQVESGFDLEPLGDVELMGKAEPVPAFRVTGERDAPVERVVTPLVGREEQLALLAGILEEVVDGRGAIVLLTGEPGIGKSRLKSEARRRFDDRVQFLEGHAVAYAGKIPYWPLRELLRDWLGLGVSDPEARVRLELRAGLSAAFGRDADDVYPFVATVLGLPLERETAERMGELSRDSVQQQTFDAVYRLACALAREEPLCLVFEDLQWADEATLALIEELFPATDDEAVTLILSYRSEDEHGAWDLAERARRRFRHRYHELELQPLEQAAALELASGAAGAELPEIVGAVLAERSGGNPFFLEEALRDLIERGVLRRRNGRLELANGADDVAVPALVQEALQARLDRLEPATREVISVASVVGRSFGMPLLEQVVARERLRPALSELQRLDLVVEERRRPAPEYRFRHGLVQEVAYGGLVEARRRDLHRVVGEALEQLHHDSPEEVYGLLARHYSEADDPARAIEFLLKAGDAARAAYANEEAVELYRRALAFMARAGEEHVARETLFKIALTHHLAFDFERAGTAFTEAFALAPAAVHRSAPTERIRTAEPEFESVVPGHTYIEHSWELCRHLFRGLVAIGRDFEIVPDLAERFVVSPDGTSYRFRLRPDALWSDGRPVAAEDFAFTWRRMREQQVETAHLLDDLRSAEALDARTLEVRLHEPRNYFLYLLGQPPFFSWPRHVCEEAGDRWHEQLPLVGNGPFVMAERGEEGALLTASPTWYGRGGNVREIEVEFRRTPTEDWWPTSSFDAAPWVRPVEASQTVLQDDLGMSTVYLAFRVATPPLDDLRIRRALAHAVDRERLVQHVGSGSADPARTGGFVPPTMPGHSHRVAPAYDPDSARALLADAGYPGGTGFRELTLGLVKGGHGTGMSAALAELFAEVGVRVQLVEAPSLPSYREAIASLDAFIWGWNADFPDPAGMIPTFLENSPTVFRDAELLELLDRARSARDQDERLVMYRKVERRWIGEQFALVPLEYPRRTSLLRPWVEGFWQNALATSTFAEVVVRPELRSVPTRA